MEANTLALILVVLFSPVLIYQSRWIYHDAEKNGMNKWLWGIFGLLNTPTNLLVYLLFKYLRNPGEKKESED